MADKNRQIMVVEPEMETVPVEVIDDHNDSV